MAGGRRFHPGGGHSPRTSKTPPVTPRNAGKCMQNYVAATFLQYCVPPLLQYQDQRIRLLLVWMSHQVHVPDNAHHTSTPVMPFMHHFCVAVAALC